MRGKGYATGSKTYHGGITPACAGKSDGYTAGRTDARDHPRVCGEKPALPPGVLAPPGSPPRMRGKDYVAHACKGRVGITPAYAGKSPTFIFASSLSRITPAYAGKSFPRRCIVPKNWDHPRVCGEKMNIGAITAMLGGSPPRMRGKEAKNFFRGSGLGITPAYAGKSRPSRYWFAAGRDHPRVCGEKTKKIP